MLKIIKFISKTKSDEQIDRIQLAIAEEIERAIKNLDDDRKLFEKTRVRPEDVAIMYNNEQLAIFKLKNLASDLRADAR